MKRFISALLLIALFTGSAFALTQSQAQEVLTNYLQKNNLLKNGHLIIPEGDKPEYLDDNKGEFWAFRHAADGRDLISTIIFYYIRVNDGTVYAMYYLDGSIRPVDEVDKLERE